MKRTTLTATAVLLAVVALAGCESQQQKNARLQADYANAYKQYQKDCVEPMSNGAANALNYTPDRTPKKPANNGPGEQQSAKCATESDKVNKLASQISQPTAP